MNRNTEIQLVARKVPIVATADELAMILRTSASRGRLLTDVDQIVPHRVGGGRFRIDVEMLMPPEVLSRRERLARFARRHPSMVAVGKALAFALAALLSVIASLAALVAAIKGAFADVNGYVALGFVALCVFGLIAIGTRGSRSGYGYHWTKCK